MRKDNQGNEHFSSFSDLAASMGIKPVQKNKKKIEYQQDKFNKKHKCKACGQPLSFIGGNIVACTNPKCRGIKNIKKLDDGTEIVTYLPSYELLDEIGENIANRIFND
jgi:hypothetical protein